MMTGLKNRDGLAKVARRTVVMAAAVLLWVGTLAAQDGPQWQRRQGATEPRLTVFHSTHGINLPTAETIGKGELLFEISHRFVPPISDGSDALWGFDGPVQLRLGLAWAPSDNVILRVIRSNLDDNLDLGIKARLVEVGSSILIGVNGGVALNSDDATTFATTQYHAELMINAALGERFAVGLVPAVVSNPWIFTDEEDVSAVLGVNAQFWTSDRLSLIGEWIFSPDVGDLVYDTGSFGIEAETGGHFFKVIVSNSFRLNPAQVLAGSAEKFELDNLRFGFNITRVLR